MRWLIFNFKNIPLCMFFIFFKCSFRCLWLPRSLCYLFFFSLFKSDLHPDLPVSSVSHSYFFLFEYFSIFPSYLKIFYMTVIRIFISKWLVQVKLKDCHFSSSAMCAWLCFTTTFIFVIVIFKNTLSWEFLANLHLKLPFVRSRST